MTWRKHFRTVSIPKGPVSNSALPASQNNGSFATGAKFSSYLPEVYAGHPQRKQRYMQYDDMDRDSVINAALDCIADFCTQSEEQSDEPFQIDFSESANETEVKILNRALHSWTKLNDFRSRLWYMFRGVVKNGDQFFIRDPETKEWLWVDHYNVEFVQIDENQGKTPISYVISNLDYNKQAKTASVPLSTSDLSGVGSTNSAPFSRGAMTYGNGPSSFNLAGSGFGGNNQISEPHIVDAKHVVHLSLGVGMDANWPFGNSVLESIFKTFKQKELLEDAVIIYRVQRAPERRLFYIDVGTMNPVMANAHVERVKNEVHQRRIPNRTGGGTSIMDAAYNPLSMMEDYFFAQTSEGRGSKVETLPGGDQLGEITDLSFFDKKLKAGLRIPSAYLPGGDEQMAYNDGKLGSAVIQEYQFNKYCLRLQSLLQPTFEKEFRQYLKDSGIQIDESLFELKFNPPQNFSKYRQIELDSSQMGVYTQIADNKRLSERFKLRRFLNLTEAEILENERLWKEENPSKVKPIVGDATGDASQHGLSSVGVSTSSGDLGGMDSEEIGDDLGGDTGDSPVEDGPIDDIGGDAGSDTGGDDEDL